ncbi:carbohydrate-binding module family 21 protein [Boletus coccyginus]|nr:carbohydrate-binding module family 21 protein [Boletus coccyginus]
MSVCPQVRRSFSDERGPGTFHSLGVLPKRTRDISTRKSPVFHIPHDDDDDHSSSLDEHPPQALSISIPSHTIRFPSSGASSPSPGCPSSTSTSRPSSPFSQLSRGASAPILLSSGKPLKSSLKSSSSSPAMLIPPHAQHMHLRARSEPSTPKNVHFPEKDNALATVRVFKRSARPAALSNPANGNGDETETEGEDTPPARFPFPRISPVLNYEIDPTKSSPVPSKSSPLNLFLESLNLSLSPPGATMKPILTGFILVRNLAFEKHVAIRFTLDDWQTVSEVGAHYVDSLSHPPSQVLSSRSPCTQEDTTPQSGRGWDRFTFTIRLEDYAHSLSTRTLWLVARYHTNSIFPAPGSSQYGPGGEWWDNNDGGNYRVGFRPAVTASTSPRNRPRREAASAPIHPPHTQPQPTMTCMEHALGLMVPSVPKNKEDRRLTPLRTGKLDLCNYSPPTVRATSSVSFPSAGSPQTSPSSIGKSALPPSVELGSSSDEDTTSPASSTLSTPSASPTIVPREIIGGQPATPTYSSSEKEEDAIMSSRPGHIAEWDWSARIKPRNDDLVPGSEPTERRFDVQSLQGLPDSGSLYDAFVSQWCFAHGYPSHNGYDGGDGIMA